MINKLTKKLVLPEIKVPADKYYDYKSSQISKKSRSTIAYRDPSPEPEQENARMGTIVSPYVSEEPLHDPECEKQRQRLRDLVRRNTGLSVHSENYRSGAAVPPRRMKRLSIALPCRADRGRKYCNHGQTLSGVCGPRTGRAVAFART